MLYWPFSRFWVVGGGLGRGETTSNPVLVRSRERAGTAFSRSHLCCYCAKNFLYRRRLEVEVALDLHAESAPIRHPSETEVPEFLLETVDETEEQVVAVELDSRTTSKTRRGKRTSPVRPDPRLPQWRTRAEGAKALPAGAIVLVSCMYMRTANPQSDHLCGAQAERPAGPCGSREAKRA